MMTTSMDPVKVAGFISLQKSNNLFIKLLIFQWDSVGRKKKLIKIIIITIKKTFKSKENKAVNVL